VAGLYDASHVSSNLHVRQPGVSQLSQYVSVRTVTRDPVHVFAGRASSTEASLFPHGKPRTTQLDVMRGGFSSGYTTCGGARLQRGGRIMLRLCELDGCRLRLCRPLQQPGVTESYFGNDLTNHHRNGLVLHSKAAAEVHGRIDACCESNRAPLPLYVQLA
jgi:hypothetical protein